MKSFLLTSTVLSLALASTAAARDLTAGERAALSGQPATDVATLRAGAAEGARPVAVAERKDLAHADGSAQGLDAMRAGDDEHTWTVVGVVVGCVILAILIF